LHQYQEKKYNEELSELDMKLLNFEDLTDSQLRVVCAFRKKVIMFLSVRTLVNQKENFEEKISAIKQVINERKPSNSGKDKPRG